jgi:Type II CAAX prenyl endopeptidase Rce1-like
MISNRMLFVMLWLVGMTGVLSTLWIVLPIPAEKLPLPLIAVKLLNLISPTFLLSIAVLGGVKLASKVGLSAPFTESLVSGAQTSLMAIKSQVIPGLVGGVFGGIAISIISSLWRSSLPADFVAKAEVLSTNTPLLTRILYGGITEEILIRWGLMSFLVWAQWRVFQKAQGSPDAVYVVFAIGISALAFGLGHLPLAFTLSSQATASLVAYIIVGNAFFGLIAGYLYWQKGLEAAIVAHVTVHLVMAIIDRSKIGSLVVKVIT